MRRLATLVAPVALALGCKSSAPYTAIAAGVNAGAALGVAGQTRAAGGCYAACTHGTWCNPHTGFCERDGAPPACVASDAACKAAYTAPLAVGREGKKGGSPAPSVGLSPETGRAPLPPGSPKQDER